MSEPLWESNVEDIVKVWEKRGGFVLPMPDHHVRSLIADWRKRGEALASVEERVWREAAQHCQDVPKGHLPDYFNSIADEVARAALTTPPQPAEATPTPSSQAK